MLDRRHLVFAGLVLGACVQPRAVLWQEQSGGADGGGTGLTGAPDVDSSGALDDEASGGAEADEATGDENASCVLRDSFDEAQFDDSWAPFEDGVTLAAAGALSIDVPAFSDSQYAGLLSRSIDMTQRAARIRVVQAPPPNTAVQFFLGVRQSDVEGAARYDIYLKGEAFTVQYKDTAGVNEQLADVPHASDAQPWLSTRLDGDDIVFERSADGQAWEEVLRTANALDLSSATIALVGGAHASEDVASVIRLDDLSVCDVAG